MRVRTMLAATLVVAVALALAAVALVVLQRRQLVAGLTDLATDQGTEIATQIERSGPAAVDVAAIQRGAVEQSLVQVLAPDGSVLAASASVTGEQAVTAVSPGAGEVVVRTVDRLPIGEDERFVVVTRGVATPDGVVRVVTARSLETVQESTTVVVSLLAVGYPVILLVVAWTSYYFAGRALAPVETIRRRVGEVTAADLGARVPVPSSGDEIARLADTMNAMLDRLQASAAAQGRFVADASHELRSPLATIRAVAELARSHPAAVDWPAGAETVLAEARRLEELVADLLVLASADERGVALRLTDVDLDDLVVSDAARLRRAGGVVVELDVRSVRVRGDANQLARVLRNLTDNAVRHARSTVRLRLRAESGTARLEVRDDGAGIAEEDRERVFERFVRLDSSRERRSGGAGLGLAIVQEIAHAHGGTVEVGRPDGAGALFVLTLPLPGDQPSSSRQ